MSWSINGKTVKSLMKDGKEIVKVERVEDGKVLYEKQNNYSVATIAGNNVTLGASEVSETHWLLSNGDVKIDWGDGTSDTVNNPTTMLSHTYTDGKSSHDIVLIGEITGLGNYCFSGCTGLTSVTIPNSVTSLGGACFYGCTGLTSITIPNSVTSLGGYCFSGCTGLTSITIPNLVTTLGRVCFYGCTSIIDYQLYWTGNNIITYDSYKMPNNTNTKFYVPSGQKTNYINKGYPSNKLVERSA